MTKSTRWLVTGATGLLGANAGRYLNSISEAAGITAIAMNRASDDTEYFHETVRGDLTDPKSLRTALETARPDVVLHAGALASHEACENDPVLAERINVGATAELAASARDADAAFVYISTDAVFDGERGDYAETDVPHPFSVYGRTKHGGESAAAAVCPESLILRTNFFGWSPSGNRSILEFFVNSLRENSSVHGFTDFTVTSIYAQHLLAAIAELVESGSTGLVHLASHDSLTKYEFACIVADVFGLDANLITPSTSRAVGLPTSRARNLSLNVSHCESLLGRSMPSQRDGLIAALYDELEWLPPTR